jgi:hypothetical protein
MISSFRSSERPVEMVRGSFGDWTGEAFPPLNNERMVLNGLKGVFGLAEPFVVGLRRGNDFFACVFPVDRFAGALFLEFAEALLDDFVFAGFRVVLRYLRVIITGKKYLGQASYKE